MRYYIPLFLASVLLSGCAKEKASPVQAQITQPSPPGEPQARKFSDGEVSLVWAASDDPDLKAYHIYRSEGNDRQFSKVATVTEAQFHDIGLTYDTPYFYRIVAVNSAGIESQPVYISGRPLNNLWPATPKALLAEARNLQMFGFVPEIELTWTANNEADFKTYRVYGDTQPNFAPSRENLLAEVEFPGYRHPHVTVGANYYYQVTAVDRGDLESQAAPAAVALMNPPVLEQPTNGLYADPEPLFVWQSLPLYSPDAEVQFTVSLAEGPSTRELWVAEVEGNQTQLKYEGPTLEPGTYWWKVLAEMKNPTDNSMSIVMSRLAHFRAK